MDSGIHADMQNAHDIYFLHARLAVENQMPPGWLLSIAFTETDTVLAFSWIVGEGVESRV